MREQQQSRSAPGTNEAAPVLPAPSVPEGAVAALAPVTVARTALVGAQEVSDAPASGGATAERCRQKKGGKRRGGGGGGGGGE